MNLPQSAWAVLPSRSAWAVVLVSLLVLASIPAGTIALSADMVSERGENTAPMDGKTAAAGPPLEDYNTIRNQRTGASLGESGGMGGLAAQSDSGSGSLSQSTYTVTRGNEVEISFSHSEAATLYVGDEDAGYRLQVDVGGSGSSTVTIDTYASKSGNPTDYVSGGDPTVLYPSGELKQSLVPGSYNLNLTVNGTVEDLGMLVIEERPPATLEAGVAPGTIDILEVSQGDLQSATTPRKQVAKGDYAVFEINATGLGGAIDPAHLDGTGTAEGLEFAIEDLDPPPNRDGESYRGVSNQALHPFWDEDAETLLIAWNTEDVPLSGGGHDFNVTFRLVAEENNLVTEDTLDAQVNVTVVSPKINLDTSQGQLSMYPWEPAVLSLSGTTTYAPGTEFEFRAKAVEPRPFLKKSETTVGADGNFSTEIDFSGEARGIEPSLWIQGYRGMAEWRVSLREAQASFDFGNQTVDDGGVARVSNVSLTVGGLIVVNRTNGTVVGVSEPVGESPRRNLSVPLSPPLNRSAYLTARAVMDVNGNGTYESGTDQPYTRNGSAVTETAVVFVPETGEPPSPDRNTTTTTVSPANNTTTTPVANNTTMTPSNTTVTTSTVTTLSVKSRDALTPGGTGGSASLSLALPILALVAAALLARREE